MQGSRIPIGAAALVALFILAGVGGLWYSLSRSDTPAAAPEAMAEEKLDLVTSSGVRTLQVEIARTPAQQAKGLMFRNALADDHGMLFPHSKARDVAMWMRNTYIPLDMVFIKEDGTVLRIEAHTEPLSERIIESDGPVTGVLELAGGAAERLGLKPGDKVRHPHFKAP